MTSSPTTDTVAGGLPGGRLDSIEREHEEPILRLAPARIAIYWLAIEFIADRVAMRPTQVHFPQLPAAFAS
jgi:hypothetical protein